MKRLRGILIVVAVAIVGLAVGKNLIAQAAVVGGVKMVAGLDALLTGMQVAVRKPVIAMKDFTLLNPSGYPDRVMLKMPELYIDYDLGSFLKGNAHLRHIRLHLAEFTVVKRADGQLNLDRITALQQKKPAEKQPAGKQPAGPEPQLQIDVLELNIGKVVYKDYTRQPVLVQEFPVNIKERYEHIDNPYTLAGLIVTKALMRTSIAQLANFDLAGLQTGVNDALKSSAELATRMAATGLDAAQEMSKSALGTTSDILRHPGETVGEVGNTGKQALSAPKDVTKALKKLFNN